MKKILLSLFVGLIGLINFGYCEIYNIYNNEGLSFRRISIGNGQTLTYSNPDGNVWCFQVDTSCNSDCGTITDNDSSAQLVGWGGNWTCTNKEDISIYAARNIQYYYYVFFSEDLARHYFPNYTSLECQTEYNLIPISSVDQNYCLNNGLCPSSECPDIPLSGNWSALYINDIQHLGKPIINITFPDYLDWDYTTDENEFNLDIVGYPVDTEYMDGIIRTQNYKPTSEDFTQLVGMLAPYSKYLLFLLFIFIIWAWIKKPFKSKKL